MALDITSLQKIADGAMYVSPARLCLSEGDELVSCDAPEAVRLLVGEGGSIPTEVAEKYGLIARRGEFEPRAAETVALIDAGAPEAQSADGSGEVGVAPATDTPEPSPQLSSMNLSQLRALAKDRGIAVASSAKKADLVAAIEAATEVG